MSKDIERLARAIEEELKRLTSSPSSIKTSVYKDKNRIAIRFEDKLAYWLVKTLVDFSEAYRFSFHIEAEERNRIKVDIWGIDWLPFSKVSHRANEIVTLDDRLFIKTTSWYEVRPNRKNVRVLKRMVDSYLNKKVLEGGE